MSKVPQIRGGGPTKKVSRKAMLGKEKENQVIDKTKGSNKGLKRSNSENQALTRKRTAFGDITNAIQSHAERIAQARKKVSEKKCVGSKPVKSSNHGKRVSNRLKSSKSFNSLVDVGISVDDRDSGSDDMSISEQCDEILQSAKRKDDLDASVLPEGVVPFDQDEDPDHVCEYAHSIFRNMRKREAMFPIVNYFTNGEERSTTSIMRAILIDWLVEVQENFQLYHETLYVAVKLLDSYLQHNDTSKEQLQLVGATALLIACKVEERQPPPLDDFQYICDDAYSVKHFIEMEMKIFKALKFDINIPISYRYLRRFSRVTSMGMENLTLARFILELSLHSPSFIHEPPSRMAAASLCLAMKMANAGEWNPNHCYHSGYQESELNDLMKQLNQMLIESPDSKLKTVRNKYSHPIHFSVAKTKPLPSSAFPV